jgi:hypothetical protein
MPMMMKHNTLPLKTSECQIKIYSEFLRQAGVVAEEYKCNHHLPGL